MPKTYRSPPRAIWPTDHQREGPPFGGDKPRGDEAELARRQSKQAEMYALADQIAARRVWPTWRAEEAAAQGDL